MMRDIRPMGNKDNGDDFPESNPVPPLPPRKEPFSTPPSSFIKKSNSSQHLPGAKVPVTNINVPTEKITRTPLSQKKVIRESIPTASRTASSVRIGHRERTVLLTLLGLLIVAGVLAAVIFLPHADIKLILRTAPLLVDEHLIVRAEPGGESNTITGSAFFREVPVEGTYNVKSTEVVGKKATGTLKLVNRTIEEQKIKERSRLVTKNEVLFYMTKSVTIAPNSTATVTVEAAEAGEQGNIDPQQLNFAALDPSSQSLVYAEATEKLTGGSGEIVNVIKNVDLDAAKQAAGEAARAQVEQDIRGALPKGWVVLEESWKNEVSSFETEAKEDTRQQFIPYKAQVIVRVIGHEKEALEARLKTALEQRMAEDYMLFPGPISYTAAVENVNWEQSEASISARVTHTTIPRFSLETLRGKLAGQKGVDAQKYLEGLPGVRSVTLDLSPFWVQSIPRIEKRISLDLQPERQP